MIYVEKVIIVEGTSDRRKIESIIREPVEIVCTNGTIELVDQFFDKEVYVLVDADDAGEKLRKQFRKEFPQAEHIYIDRSYREVATAPSSHLANVLWGADIDVYTEYLR